VTRYQTVKAKMVDRADHVWAKTQGGRYKCMTCGAITQSPPAYPTPDDWRPERYERLTAGERELVPFVG
jgi:hypothetical protein